MKDSSWEFEDEVKKFFPSVNSEGNVNSEAGDDDAVPVDYYAVWETIENIREAATLGRNFSDDLIAELGVDDKLSSLNDLGLGSSRKGKRATQAPGGLGITR